MLGYLGLYHFTLTLVILVFRIRLVSSLRQFLYIRFAEVPNIFGIQGQGLTLYTRVASTNYVKIDNIDSKTWKYFSKDYEEAR